jgi:hypothetical protein
MVDVVTSELVRWYATISIKMWFVYSQSYILPTGMGFQVKFILSIGYLPYTMYSLHLGFAYLLWCLKEMLTNKNQQNIQFSIMQASDVIILTLEFSGNGLDSQFFMVQAAFTSVVM